MIVTAVNNFFNKKHILFNYRAKVQRSSTYI